MKNWTPILIAVVAALLINAYPYVMAFVVRAEGWAQAGWVYYFYTIPAGIALIVLGLIISLVLFFRRRSS